MIGGTGARHPGLRAAIGLALLLASAAFVAGSRLVDVVTGYERFAFGFVLGGLQDAQPFLVLAAVLLAGAALGARHRIILVGATLWAIGALASQALLLWFQAADAGMILSGDPALLVTYQDANLVANTVAVAGTFGLAWGVGRPSWRPASGRHSPGRARVAALAVVGAAAVAATASVAPFAFAPPEINPAIFAAFIVVAMLGVAASEMTALVALAVAKPGPPLDWRWPVGIGFGIALLAGAVTGWSSIASAGGAFGAWWWTWLRGAQVCGGLLAAAGFAIAAAVRWPAREGPSTSPGPGDLPAIGS